MAIVNRTIAAVVGMDTLLMLFAALLAIKSTHLRALLVQQLCLATIARVAMAVRL